MGNPIGQRSHGLQFLTGEGFLLRAPILGDILAGAKDMSGRAFFIEQDLAGERNRAHVAVRTDDLKLDRAPAAVCITLLDVMGDARSVARNDDFG